jgi:RNA polymerase sigma-70 factor (ECF subfamily)
VALRRDPLEIEKRWLLLVRIDREYFFLFYDRYVDRIYRYIFWRTHDPDLAQDLTADTFMTALAKLQLFRFQGVTFGAWLYRIALNLVREHFRARQSRSFTDLTGAENLPDRRRNPLDELEYSEEQTLILDLLEMLDELSQNIFILHYWENLKVREIAAILNVSQGTIQSRLKRDRDWMARIVRRRLFQERWLPESNPKDHDKEEA